MLLFSSNIMLSQKSNDSLNKKPAEFIGGKEALTKFIQYEFKDYDRYFYETSLGGKCVVKFSISKDGQIDSVKTIRTSCVKTVDSISELIISKMPKWNPATINNVAVNSSNAIPINFISHKTPTFLFNCNYKEVNYLETKKLIIAGKYFEALGQLSKCDVGEETLFVKAVLLYKLNKKNESKKTFEETINVKNNSDMYRLSKEYLNNAF